MVWGQYSKTVISLLLGVGCKRIIYQMKGNIFLHAKIGNEYELRKI